MPYRRACIISGCAVAVFHGFITDSTSHLKQENERIRERLKVEFSVYGGIWVKSDVFKKRHAEDAVDEDDEEEEKANVEQRRQRHQ